MRVLISLLCTASVLCSVLSFAGSAEKRELSAPDLLAEYEKLAPVNETLKEGRWDVLQNGHYPKTLGTFNSLEVREVFRCGDRCPQYGSVNIIYANIKQDDCPPIGWPLYSHFWITQYEGCTPLISADGHLTKTGVSPWSIAYYPDGDASKPATNEPLLFDDSSLCSKGGEKISCDGFRDGQKASVKGTRSGEAIAILKLDL